MLASSKNFGRWVLALALLALPGTALGEPVSKTTLFTFDQPIALPGVALPAGTYLFRLAPAGGGRVVQVLSADGRTPYAQFFAMDEYVAEAPSTPSVRFTETATGLPAAIDAWLYPGERRGFKFVYPREQARLLAQRSDAEPVARTASLPAPATSPGVAVNQ